MNQSMFSCIYVIIKNFDLHRIRPELQRSQGIEHDRRDFFAPRCYPGTARQPCFTEYKKSHVKDKQAVHTVSHVTYRSSLHGRYFLLHPFAKWGPGTWQS